MLRSPERSLRIEELEGRRLLALNPTADEQYMMQLINRFRSSPNQEFTRLIASASPIRARDPVLQDDLEFANVNGNTLRTELNRLSAARPLVWNEAIRDFSRDHNRDMISRGVHYHSNTSARRAELEAAGVNFRYANGEKINSELVYGYGKSVLHSFASYVIDWQRGGPGGMVSGRAHRAALINSDFEQAGIGFTNHNGNGNPPLGPKVNTTIAANIEQEMAFVTGAIFRDQNNSGWYEPGEGLSNVRFTFTNRSSGESFQTTGFTAGGYQIALPPGSYMATASGGGMRFTQRVLSVSVGTENKWLNWKYDPNTIPPDKFENNNRTSNATRLDGDQQHSGLGIHTGSDQDYFRIQPVANGMATFQINFARSSGELQLNLLNGSGTVLQQSESTANAEVINYPVVRGTTYYLQVIGENNDTHSNYRLTIDTPEPRAGIGNADRAVFTGSSNSIQINVLANDTNPDGASNALTPKLVNGTHPAFSIASNKRVEYSAPDGYAGVHRARYTTTNEHDLESPATTIEVFVLDFDRETPWRNPSNSVDVNDDAQITAIDALLAINALNNNIAELPTSAAGADQLFGFVDTSGDGFLTALDALQVINRLSGFGESEGEGEGVGDATPNVAHVPVFDLAFANADWLDWQDDKERRMAELALIR